ncbi:Complement factor H-related protein 3-like [Homarus americanus]|uniref:Complement factor H-related protein 3-like n=1 Tax=Homarus americanus TaxID=6706 RepID=A0A8J5JP10_HOMAM|nr:Complement factor H-related protein 3-like [Homarus americanus]
MMEPRRLEGVLGLLLLTAVSVGGMCPTSAESTKEVTDLEVGIKQAWTCPAGMRWNNNMSVIIVRCDKEEPPEQTETCIESTTQCTDAPPTIASTTATALPNSQGHYYTCVKGTAWLSSRSYGHVSSCKQNGQFHMFLDACEKECPLPRDCSVLYTLGFKTSGIYKVLPLGSSRDGIMVECDMGESTPDKTAASGGWTLMLRHHSSNGVMEGATHVLRLGHDSCYGCRPLILKADLTGSEIKWPPLSNTTIDKVTIWLRPLSYDKDSSCPPLVGADPSWPTNTKTNVTVPVSRSPGTNITYRCTQSYYLEGKEAGVRSSSGVVQCVTNSVANTHSWNYSLATADKECLVVTSKARKYVSCNDSTIQAVCMLPGYCPPDYTRYRGLCYQVKFDQGDDLVGALAECNKEGSSLAYPQDLDTLKYLSTLVYDLATADSKTLPLDVMVGLNNVWGDWSASGIYTVSSDIQKAVKSPSTTTGWRLLTVPETKEGDSTFKEATGLTGNDATTLICQHLGPMGCWDAPWEPTTNMTRSSWTWESTETALATVLVYTCYPGYFLNANLSLSSMTVKCVGQLGGWYPRTVHNCFPIDVCTEDLPTAPSSLMTREESTNVRYLNGSINFTCPANMSTQEGNTTQTITCVYENSTYLHHPATVAPCDVCLGEPTVGNATTDWDLSNTYKINTTVTATCNEKHVATLTNNTQVVTCTETGWEQPPACYAESNMTRANFTANTLGTTITYTCEEGLYTITNQTYTVPQAEITATCNSDAQWTYNGTALHCTTTAPALGSHDWDGFTKESDTQVVYTCDETLFFGDESSNITVTCQQGNWTTIDQNIFQCRQVTAPPPPFPDGVIIPTSGGSAASSMTFWAGDTLNITCAEGKVTPTGVNMTTITNNGTAWSPIDPEFECFDVAENPTLPPGVSFAMPPATFYVGQNLTVGCAEGMEPVGDLQVVYITYNGTDWSPVDPDFICRVYRRVIDKGHYILLRAH